MKSVPPIHQLPAPFRLKRLLPADGAFYIYADVSDWTDDAHALAGRLLSEAGVAVTPGVDFDAARGRLWFAGGGVPALFWIDVRGADFAQHPVADWASSPGAPLVMTASPGFDYDPTRDRFYGFVGAPGSHGEGGRRGGERRIDGHRCLLDDAREPFRCLPDGVRGRGLRQAERVRALADRADLRRRGDVRRARRDLVRRVLHRPRRHRDARGVRGFLRARPRHGVGGRERGPASSTSRPQASAACRNWASSCSR